MAHWVEKLSSRSYSFRNQPGFEIGRALLTPERSKSGGDIYKLMRSVEPGDIILHLTDSAAFTGWSIARSKASIVSAESGLWYRIELSGHAPLNPPLRREDFFKPPFSTDLQRIADGRGRNLFFEWRLRMRQGAYLTPLAPDVLTVLDAAYLRVAGRTISEQWSRKQPTSST